MVKAVDMAKNAFTITLKDRKRIAPSASARAQSFGGPTAAIAAPARLVSRTIAWPPATKFR